MNYLVVVNDAGAANILLSYISSSLVKGNFDVLNKGNIEFNETSIIRKVTLQEALIKLENKGYNGVLTGTSGNHSDIEYFFIGMARTKGIHVASVVDHWVNYKSRFIRYDELIVPNEIWVCDEKALQLAGNVFKDRCSIRMISNKYIENTLEYIKNNKQNKYLLYLTEPNVDNTTAIEFIKAKFPDKLLYVKRHPSDLVQYTEPHAPDDLKDALSWTYMAFGHDTMALHIADLAGIESYTFLDPNELNIPLGNIENVSKLL